ncbi:MAG TPA: S49 family peptidase [Polyangiaceae bacterium]|nr:S49 family peptidase [Polyangiaceae bacterium]
MRTILRTLCGAAAVAAVACHARPRTWSSAGADLGVSEAKSSAFGKGVGEIAEIDLTRGAPEITGTNLLNARSQQNYFRLVTLLQKIGTEPGSRGILVRFGSARFGWARAQELAELFGKLRDAKKGVVCHADGYANASMWIAARGCDQIWVSPAGGVETVGIAAELLYAHRLLTEKLGIDVDFLQIGKFKGAEEPFTRDGPSPEARASLEGVLGAIREQWLSGVGGARGDALRASAEDGPFSPEEAKRRGLIDAVGYLDEARDEAKKRTGGQGFDVRFGVSAHATERPDFTELVRALAGGSGSHGGPPHIAVVRAAGAISMESGGGPFGQSSGITERGLGRTVRSLTEDGSVKAVVLRIDSPGGSALASDLLWRSLMQLRAKKPLVVSIGDMAASGGYYLASTANRIFAEPTSIVGSIGVVGGKLAFARALDSVGVHVEPIGAPGSSAAKRASYQSPLLPWDPVTRERVRIEMTAIYELFVRRVAEGRGVGAEVISGSAEGRIFAGPAAQEAKLVDEWGGLERAIRAAKELAKLDENAPVRLTGESGGLFEWFSDDDEGADDAHASGLARTAIRAATALPDLPGAEAFFGSLAPLLRGETTLAALPFVLLMH